MTSTSSLPTLAITGSTGALGGSVARSLAARGIAQRLLARNPEQAPRLDGAVAVAAAVAYADKDAAVRALDGVATLFMVSAGEAVDRLSQHRTFIDAATEAGVQHIVYTSFYGAARDCTFTLGRDHFATEEHIKQSGVRHHTFLRNNLYLDILPLLAGDDGVIRGPAGDGRLAAVAREDIARAATAVLTEPDGHREGVYRLTGPEDLSLSEVAATISAATGKDVTFHNETVPEAYASRRKWGAPDWQNDAWVSTYTAIASGEVSGVTKDIEHLTGRAPLSLEALLAARC